MSLADRLRPYVDSIQKDAAAGDKNAQQIIKLYQMHVASPGDPGALAFCESYFRDWLRSRAELKDNTR